MRRRIEAMTRERDHAPPDRSDNPGAQQYLLVHLLAPEIQVAVAQANLLARVLVGIDLQRQQLGARANLERRNPDLDLAGRQTFVDRLRAALHHRAGHRDHAFHAHRLELREQRARHVDHALGQAEIVAQIDEQKLAVVAFAVDPAGQAHGFAGVGKP
jgi:hypothetical protein